MDKHVIESPGNMRAFDDPDKAFVEQCMAFRRAIVGHSQDILFCAKNETSSIWRTFDDHRSHERQALVEQLTDNDRPLSLLLSGI